MVHFVSFCEDIFIMQNTLLTRLKIHKNINFKSNTYKTASTDEHNTNLEYDICPKNVSLLFDWFLALLSKSHKRNPTGNGQMNWKNLPFTFKYAIKQISIYIEFKSNN